MLQQFISSIILEQNAHLDFDFRNCDLIFHILSKENREGILTSISMYTPCKLRNIFPYYRTNYQKLVS